MKIRHVEVSNYKSFHDISIDLGKLNIFIGGNASGKSNFVGIFEFIRNIINHGVDNAISMEGGTEYLRNLEIGSSENLRLLFVYDPEVRFVDHVEKSRSIGVKYLEAEYEFALRFHKRGKGFSIEKDRFCVQYEFVELQKDEDREYHEVHEIGRGFIEIEVKKGKLKFKRELPSEITLDTLRIFPGLATSKISLPARTLFLETPFFVLFHQYERPVDSIAIYDFDPRLPKKAVSITGRTELEEDGSNLSFVLKRISDNADDKRKFINLLGDMLPFVDNMKVTKFADRSLLFMIHERYHDASTFLPATFVSDGTIQLACIIVASYFEDKDFLIIEEPERNIHPHLISRLVGLFDDVANRKQVTLTTHNPEIVRNSDLGNLILVSRDQNGFSTIVRPRDKSHVQGFLAADMGVDDLYIQDLLGLIDET